MSNFLVFQFKETNGLWKNQTIIEHKNIILEDPEQNNDTNNYNVGPFEIFQHSNGSNKFGIKIPFQRNHKGISSILINYHMICGIFVILSSINFVFEPRDTNRSCMLVALILVLATFFSAAQVKMNLIIKFLTCISIDWNLKKPLSYCKFRIKQKASLLWRFMFWCAWFSSQWLWSIMDWSYSFWSKPQLGKMIRSPIPSWNLID